MKGFKKPTQRKSQKIIWNSEDFSIKKTDMNDDLECINAGKDFSVSKVLCFVDQKLEARRDGKTDGKTL